MMILLCWGLSGSEGISRVFLEERALMFWREKWECWINGEMDQLKI